MSKTPLPQADPLDTPRHRVKQIVRSLPSVAQQVWLKERPDFQEPTPFELASLAAAMPSTATPHKRVSSAYDLWEEACKLLSPKPRPVATLKDVLEYALPKKPAAKRQELLRGLLSSEAFAKNVKTHSKGNPLSPADMQLVGNMFADHMIENYSKQGVEYPQELSDRLVTWAEAKAKEGRIARAKSGGKGKSVRRQEGVKTEKTKKVLERGQSPASKDATPASKASASPSNKWVSRKHPPKMR